MIQLGHFLLSYSLVLMVIKSRARLSFIDRRRFDFRVKKSRPDALNGRLREKTDTTAALFSNMIEHHKQDNATESEAFIRV